MKSSSERKEASLELLEISFTYSTLAYGPPSLQFYQPFLIHERHPYVSFPAEKGNPEMQSAENCHRFWLHLRHVMILISKVRTSGSKRTNLMALIQTLTISTTSLKA